MSDSIPIPRRLLEEMNEFTTGGFILFYTDSNGDSQYLPYVDNSTIGRGLMSFIFDVSRGLRRAESNDIENSFLEPRTNEIDGEEEDS